MVDNVYQPTRKFCDHLLSKLGVETTYYDPLLGAGIAELVRPNTRVIFTESPGSQTFEVQDIPAIARVAAERELWLLMDNTWATSLYFRPFEHGVDVSIQAATKYIVGHADAMLGAITSNARAARHIAQAKDLLGVCPGSEETYLGMRGLRTLATRLAQHQRSALEIARWLEARPEVSRVLHPGLPSHPQHALWKRDFLGCSGLFAVVLKPASQKAVAAMLDGLKLFGMGFSWAATKASSFPSMPAPIEPPPNGSPRARRCACTSASRTSTICAPTWKPGLSVFSPPGSGPHAQRSPRAASSSAAVSTSRKTSSSSIATATRSAADSCHSSALAPSPEAAS